MIMRYEDLEVWKRADTLAHKVYDLTLTFPRRYALGLTSQLERAVLSVPTNIVEGTASTHLAELLQSLNISRRSLRETKYLLEFSLKRKLIKEDIFSELSNECQIIEKMLNSLIRSLRNSKSK